METNSLVLLHGYPFDHSVWDPVVAGLGREVRILAPDLRGFDGRSPGAEEPSLELMADDVAKQLDAENIGKAVVAGFSMGGYVALALAERHPRLLAGLGLVSSQPFADTDEGRAGRRAMIERVRREGISPAVEAVLPKMFSAARAGDPELQRLVREGASKAGVPGITWALEAMARRPERLRVFEDLAVPRLIVHGSDDQLVNVTRIRELAKRLTSTLYVEVPGAGHCVLLEQPRSVASTLARLLELC